MRDQLGRHVVDWTELPGGTNNRLVRLDTDVGPLLAKLYRRDRWNRLEREFGMLTLLRDRGVGAVPQPYLRSDAFGYAVYSFEPGHPWAPADLETGHLRAAAAFAAELHRFHPDSVDTDVPPAIGSGFSLQEQLDAIDARLRTFEEYAADPAADDEVVALRRDIDLRDVVAASVRRAMGDRSPGDLARSLPREEWRLSTGDFGAHNLLIEGTDRLTVVDFEWSGWDDPARLVMGFVAHAGSEGLSPAGVDTFLGTYAAMRGLSRAEIARFERVGALLDIEWIAVYASALTPETVAAKQFATADFDRRAYLTSAIAKLQDRVARATAGAGYRFPPLG